MSVKVSIVIPVYNPGPYIEACIDSIIGQSLPEDAYEAIFVDDGSTDETPGRLDRLAADHANVRVIHIPNSGGPGKPRNVGIDAASGEFVQFVDADDWLGPQAMQRMYEYGVANDADVIIGKMASQGRAIPRELFRVNRPTATLDSAPLIDSLTPHKMFRRSFLTETGLRYPEGSRRLEDHAFVVEGYLRARNVAVLSDYVCYYHTRRDDGANISLQLFDPVGYFANLREALDVVERFIDAGPLRDKLHRRWFRNEMIERMRGRRMLRWPADHRAQMFNEIHKLAAERFGPGVATGLSPMHQIVAALIMAGQLDETIALAEWEAGISAAGFLRDLRWTDGTLRIAYDAEFQVGAKPMMFRRSNGAELLDPPLGPAGRAAVATQGADTAAQAGQVKADLVVRRRETSAEFFLPIETKWEFVGSDDRRRLMLHTVATIDPLIAGGGSRLPDGIWDLYVRISGHGWAKETRLAAAQGNDVTASRTGAAIGDPARLILPYWTEPHGTLALDAGQATNRFAAELAGVNPAHVTVDERQLRVALPLHVSVRTGLLIRYTEASTRRQTETTGVVDVGGVLTVDLPPRGANVSRTRIDVAFPAVAGNAPRYTQLGVVLEIGGRALPRVIKKGTKPVAGPTSRYAPRRVLASVRRRAGRIKRRLIG